LGENNLFLRVPAQQGMEPLRGKRGRLGGLVRAGESEELYRDDRQERRLREGAGEEASEFHKVGKPEAKDELTL